MFKFDYFMGLAIALGCPAVRLGLALFGWQLRTSGLGTVH